MPKENKISLKVDDGRKFGIKFSKLLLRRGKEYEQFLLSRIHTDPLTQVYNAEKIKQDLSDCKDVAVLLLNIDGFGRINNAYGFEAGDYVLKKSVELLSHNIPKNGRLYRMFGDEFAIVLFNPLELQEVKLAQQITSFFSQSYIELNNIEFKMTFSIGVARSSGIQSLKKAAIALLESRGYGRNRFQIYVENSIVERRIQKNFIWQTKIKEALEEDRLIAFYQPIMNNSNGKIEKFEPLIRITENGKAVSPGEFLESAKESGLLSTVTRTIISHSFKLFSKNSYDLSVNITEDDLKDESFISFIEYKLKINNINPHRIYFEILEGISTSDAKQSLEMLKKLKALGCNLSVDDFGTEHSNFSRLLELQVDIIKIDGSFIKTLTTSAASRSIVKAIVNFAQSINAKVVAEFVSSKDIFDVVVDMGINYSQGYYIGEPKAVVE